MSDAPIKVQILVSSGNRATVIGEMESRVLATGNTLEQDMEETGNVVRFLREAADLYESENTRENLEFFRSLMQGPS